MQLQVALTLHGFTLYVPHFMRGLCLCQMNSHYVMHYTFRFPHFILLKDNLSILLRYCVSHTRISLYTIHLEKQKSRKVRASLLTDRPPKSDLWWER